MMVPQQKIRIRLQRAPSDGAPKADVSSNSNSNNADCAMAKKAADSLMKAQLKSHRGAAREQRSSRRRSRSGRSRSKDASSRLRGSIDGASDNGDGDGRRRSSTRERSLRRRSRSRSSSVLRTSCIRRPSDGGGMKRSNSRVRFEDGMGASVSSSSYNSRGHYLPSPPRLFHSLSPAMPSSRKSISLSSNRGRNYAADSPGVSSVKSLNDVKPRHRAHGHGSSSSEIHHSMSLSRPPPSSELLMDDDDILDTRNAEWPGGSSVKSREPIADSPGGSYVKSLNESRSRRAHGSSRSRRWHSISLARPPSSNELMDDDDDVLDIRLTSSLTSKRSHEDEHHEIGRDLRRSISDGQEGSVSYLSLTRKSSRDRDSQREDAHRQETVHLQNVPFESPPKKPKASRTGDASCAAQEGGKGLLLSSQSGTSPRASPRTSPRSKHVIQRRYRPKSSTRDSKRRHSLTPTREAPRKSELSMPKHHQVRTTSPLRSGSSHEGTLRSGSSHEGNDNLLNAPVRSGSDPIELEKKSKSEQQDSYFAFTVPARSHSDPIKLERKSELLSPCGSSAGSDQQEPSIVSGRNSRASVRSSPSKRRKSRTLSSSFARSKRESPTEKLRVPPNTPSDEAAAITTTEYSKAQSRLGHLEQVSKLEALIASDKRSSRTPAGSSADASTQQGETFTFRTPAGSSADESTTQQEALTVSTGVSSRRSRVPGSARCQAKSMTEYVRRSWSTSTSTTASSRYSGASVEGGQQSYRRNRGISMGSGRHEAAAAATSTSGILRNSSVPSFAMYHAGKLERPGGLTMCSEEGRSFNAQSMDRYDSNIFADEADDEDDDFIPASKDKREMSDRTLGSYSFASKKSSNISSASTKSPTPTMYSAREAKEDIAVCEQPTSVYKISPFTVYNSYCAKEVKDAEGEAADHYEDHLCFTELRRANSTPSSQTSQRHSKISKNFNESNDGSLGLCFDESQGWGMHFDEDDLTKPLGMQQQQQDELGSSMPMPPPFPRIMGDNDTISDNMIHYGKKNSEHNSSVTSRTSTTLSNSSSEYGLTYRDADLINIANEMARFAISAVSAPDKTTEGLKEEIKYHYKPQGNRRPSS